jgi:glutamate carboxypeptidase
VPTLDGLGVLGAGGHTLEEHLLVDSLVPQGRLLAGLLANYTSS